MCVSACVCAHADARTRARARTHTHTHTHTQTCAEVMGAKLQWWINFVWWHLTVVRPQDSICFMENFWYLELWGGSKIFVKFVQSCIYAVRLQFYAPTFCVFHSFTQLFYGSSQMAIIKIFPGFFWHFQPVSTKCKIGVLCFIASTFNMTWWN